MSDEPAGYITLEDDGPAESAPEPTPAAPEPDAAVAAAEPETPIAEPEDATDEADVLSDGTGKRYVPLAHLEREREMRKALKEQLKQPRGLSPEEQQQLDSARYIAEQLQARPDIIDALLSGRRLTSEQQRTVDRVEQVAQAPVAAPVAEFSPEELRDVAEMQGYYDAEGQPDVKQAARYLGILDRRAAKLADARVAPLIARATESASERQIEHIAHMASEMGVSPEDARPVLRELARANPAMMAESAEYGLAGVIFAAGVQALQARQRQRTAPPPAPRQPTPEAPEPLLVERSTGPAKTPTLSTADRERMKQYGVNPTALTRAHDLLKRADGGTITFGED